MKNLSIFVLSLLIGAIGIFGFNQLQTSQQQEEAARQQFQREQAAFEQAIAAQNITALHEYIAKYPNSAWHDKAVYQRNKLAYQQAAASNDTRVLADFIKQYPESRWRPHAEQALKRLHQAQQHQKRLREQEEIVAARQQNESRTERDLKVSPSRSASSDGSRERIQRALSIYQKQREQAASEAERKRKIEAREDQNARRCAQVRDQLQQYQRKRVRWYDLDDNGERVFLSKAQVERERNQLQQQYQEFCE